MKAHQNFKVLNNIKKRGEVLKHIILALRGFNCIYMNLLDTAFTTPIHDLTFEVSEGVKEPNLNEPWGSRGTLAEGK